MELYKAVECLAKLRTPTYPEGITIALDIREHTHCDLESNCRKAAELRRCLAQMGIQPEQLKDEPAVPLVTVQAPEMSMEANMVDITLTMYGRRTSGRLEMDTHPIASQLVALIARDVEAGQIEWRRRADELVRGWQATYAYELQRVKQSNILPQLLFPLEEVLAARCWLTANEDGYVFVFQGNYNPQRITVGQRQRTLDPEHVAELQRPCLFAFTVTKAYTCYAPQVLQPNGHKLLHYHSDGRRDCWGGANLPSRWDGTLGMFSRLVSQLEATLQLVNKDSYWTYQPDDWPSIDSLLDNGTEVSTW